MAVQWTRELAWPKLLAANAAIVLVYVATMQLGSLLALPPGYPSPVFPPSGVGLALVTLLGWRAVPGVVLGPLIADLAGFWPLGSPPGVITAGAAIGAAGSVAQSAIGALAFRAFIRPELDTPRDVLRFLLLAPLVCVTSATINVPGLHALGFLPLPDMRSAWVSWWAGDTIGVLLAAPLTWIFCAPPRPLWRRRIGIVALPLLIAAGAVLATYEQAVNWEHDQRLGAFRLKAQQVADSMQAEFNEHERFVQTFSNALGDVDRMLSRDKFLSIASGYADGRPELLGISWAVRVPAPERAMFEDWARRNVDPGFEIRAIGPGATLRPAPPHPVYFPLLYTAPPSNNLVLGLDFLSDPERADAVAIALGSTAPAATGPVRLVANGRNGIVLFKAVGRPGGAPVGLVALVIDAASMVQRAATSAGLAGAFTVDFRDISDDQARMVLGPGHPLRRDDYAVALRFAERDYALRFAPAPGVVDRIHGVASWTVITAGLLLTGLLGALLLLVSGERMKIEAIVMDRTTRLRDREARLQAILDNAADAIVTVDSSGRLISGNAATAALFGYRADSLPGLPFDRLVPPPQGQSPAALLARLSQQAAEDGELQGVNARGAGFPLAISVSRVLLPTEHLFVCIVRDLSEQYRSQERIYKLAHYDTLTGVENRFALRKRLDEQLAHARRAREPLAVLFIDLDYFKKINDSHGHHAGDQLLVQASMRMKDLLRDVDTLGRQGGDEFVIVLGGPLTPDSVSAVAVRLVESLSQPYQLGGATVHSGASVGVALFPGDGEDSGSLLRNADTAMYAAKRAGRGNFQFFSPAMNAATHEHLLLENRMWSALEREQFHLHLQAQVEIDTGRVIGAEVLLRWHDPELGSVEPSRFIPIAEESGLILPLGDWVLARAMQLLSEWREGGLGALRLAVNLSARQFTGEALLARLDQLLAQYRIDPSRLELEITETAAMRDPEITRRLLRQLRARGFKVAIDDFGTGYSSLSYLKLFAIDRIKIDRGFVKDIENNQNDAVIVAATIALAHSLGLSVVAEGVETHAQWGFLRDKRGDEGQGFLFARPMPAHDFLHFVRTQAQPVPGS